MKTSRFHASWWVVFAGMCAALHIAKLSPALPVLQQTLNISLVQAGFLLSAVQMASMTLGLVIGLSVDGMGLRCSMLIGLLLLSVASFLGGFVHRVEILLMLRVMEGLGFLMTVMPAPALIRRTCTTQQLSGRMGWWGTYMPLGSALALLIGPVLIAAWGWEIWWWMLAGMTLLAAFSVWRFVPVVNVLHDARGASWMARLRLTLKSAGPWWVALSFCVYSSQWLAVVGFLPTVYAQMGLPAGLIGVLTALVAGANVVGNIGSGKLLQRGWSARHLLHLGFAGMGLGAVGAFGQWQEFGFSTDVRFVCVVLFSAVGGLIPGTLFSMAVRLAPSENTVSTTVGYMQQWSALGQFAGPPLVAWVAASAGSWQWTWCVTGALCLVGAALALCIEKALRPSPV
jgi:MFS family permease